ncbi:MAG: hypothetical protein Q7K57_37460 [Burkholderiaceae bacterium]|nr:hypothetical protein [Burkholderiaceae bacterium]
MSKLKTLNTPTSAIELQRAYVYIPSTHWIMVDELRAGTTLSVSQVLTRLIYNASQDAKETNARNSH